MTTKEGALRVLYFPNVPCDPIIFEAASVAEAIKTIETITKLHLGMYAGNHCPDYADVVCLEVYDGDDWVEWYHPDYDVDIEEYMGFEADCTDEL